MTAHSIHDHEIEKVRELSGELGAAAADPGLVYDEDDVADLVSTSPAQVLRGEPVASSGKTICTHCNQPVHEGETVLVHAYRGPRDPEWIVTRLYCSACEGDLIDLELPTIVGSSELLARARLMLTSGPEMNAYLALSAVEILDQSHGDSASNGGYGREDERREPDREQETTATEDDEPSP